MSEREYLVAVACPEDHQPVRQFLCAVGMPTDDAETAWVKQATKERGRLLDGLYLSVRCDKTRDGLETLLAGHGWDVNLVDEREPRSYPARN